MIKIQAIKSNKGYYIKATDGLNYKTLNTYLFDGVNPEPSFHKEWYLIKEVPAKVSHMEHRPNINYRYVLADDTLQSEKIPAVLIKDDVVESTDCEGHTVWKPEYAFYKSLYIEVSDEQPDEEVEDEFEFNVVLEVGDIIDPIEFKYPTGSHYDRWAENNKRDTFITQGDIVHQELDKIIFPSLLIHETPCKLSSEDTYKIVREYISTHINSTVAVVTSNYDFCFTVKKRIPLVKPYTKEYEYTPPRKRKPQLKRKYVDIKEVTIFEMTHTGRNGNYQGYTPIEGFEARNENELKELVDTYLEDLINQINEPVKECPTCNGCGVLFDEVNKER